MRCYERALTGKLLHVLSSGVPMIAIASGAIAHHNVTGVSKVSTFEKSRCYGIFVTQIVSHVISDNFSFRGLFIPFGSRTDLAIPTAYRTAQMHRLLHRILPCHDRGPVKHREFIRICRSRPSGHKSGNDYCR